MNLRGGAILTNAGIIEQSRLSSQIRMLVFLQRVFLLFIVTLAASARGAPVKVEYTTVELISERTQIVPGETFNLALHFELEPHWHVYWKNPGASGLALEIDWDLPQGFSAGEIKWPAPERILLGGLVNYGYENAVTFVVPIQAPSEIATGDSISIRAEAFWLICKEVCLPGEASLSLDLPVGESAASSAHADLFSAAATQLPKSDLPWEVSASVDGKTLTLTLSEGEEAIPMDLYFYADSEGVIDPNAKQAVNFVREGVAELRLALDEPFFQEPLEQLQGVLQSGQSNWILDTSINASTARPPLNIVESETVGFEQRLLDLGLPGFLTLAFLGGLILNVMPCVLPVLSLKVFSLLKHSGQSKGQALVHGMAYTAGVVLSFLALAGVLFALRAVGERIGWGFQLQNPNFVVLLAVVFFLFALNLMGVFEIGTGLVGADTKVSKRHDALGSFGMGVLAAVVGAPCMGPLVASVSGIAVQANVATGLLIFGVMGLGLASPFLVLSIFPKLVAYLPKPGVWMESFKQFMGFLLMAAVVFLALVVGRQGGVDAILAILVVLLFVGLAAWIYGRWSVPVKSKRTRRIAQVLSAALLVAVSIYGVGATKAAYLGFEVSAPTEGAQWAAWSNERVETELAAGNPVFIDFTATWCLICQVNKKVALRTDATEALFKEYGVVTLEADWTRYDSQITDELERFGRSGVPLYLLYSPEGEVTVLPQSLTNRIIRDAVEKALK